MHSLAPSFTINIRKNYGYIHMSSMSLLSDPHRLTFNYTIKSLACDISPPNVTNLDTVAVINRPETLDLIPIVKLPKPLTNSNHENRATLRVAYQGIPGAYSETASKKAYPNCEPIPCNQSEDAFRSVEFHITDRAVLPIENSLSGSIHRNYDLLLRHRLHIVRELHLSFNHCLLALPGVRTHHLNRVISHPQALAQCEHTLTNLISHATRAAVGDTAGAAKLVAVNNLRDTAAIASSRAAEIYNLNILADRIEDDSNNVTRFVILSREPVIPVTGRRFKYKTSIVFGECKGSNTNTNTNSNNVLYKVLAAFAFRNIKLTKIESRPNLNRPVRDKQFEYVYFVDFEASMADVRAQNAMNEVEEFTSFLRVLGSYPMDN